MLLPPCDLRPWPQLRTPKGGCPAATTFLQGPFELFLRLGIAGRRVSQDGFLLGLCPRQPESRKSLGRAKGPCPLNTDPRATAMVNSSRPAAPPEARSLPGHTLQLLPLLPSQGPLQGLLHLSGLLSFPCHHYLRSHNPCQVRDTFLPCTLQAIYAHDARGTSQCYA